MDERTALLLGKLPLPTHISILDAADILGGSHWEGFLMREVMEGHLFSWSHSPLRGPIANSNNLTLGIAHALPRITDKTCSATVFVGGKDILWRWCVEHESVIQGVEQPPRVTVEAREQLVLKLASNSLSTAASPDQPEHSGTNAAPFGQAPAIRLAISEKQGVSNRWNVPAIAEAQEAFKEFFATDSLQPRYADDASNNEYKLAWWDHALNASMWWKLKSAKPKEAAMLLCGLNPHDSKAYGEGLATEGEPRAEHYRAMLRWFEDVARDGEARTLRHWLDFSTERGLKHHSWVDEWLTASSSQDPALDQNETAGAVIRHSTNATRRNVLTHLIDRAVAQCVNGLDAAEVWVKLQRLATDREAPFLGGATEEGLQYEDGEQTRYLTKRQLRDRMRRRAKDR